MLRDPVTVKVDPVTSTVAAIEQSVYLVDKKNKKLLLTKLLREKGVGSALVFTRTKHAANNVVKELGAAGITALAIHGNKSQGARQIALNSFKDGSIKVLVATDIAARGIDIPELSHAEPERPRTQCHRLPSSPAGEGTG